MLSILLSSLCVLSNWILITFTTVPSIITSHHDLFYHLQNVNSCVNDKKQSNLSSVCYPNGQWLQGCSFVTTSYNHKYLLRSFYMRDVETLLIYEIKACIVWILMRKTYWHPVRGSVAVLVSHGTEVITGLKAGPAAHGLEPFLIVGLWCLVPSLYSPGLWSSGSGISETVF